MSAPASSSVGHSLVEQRDRQRGAEAATAK